MGAKRITQEEIDEAVKLRETGTVWKDIANTLGRDVATIRFHCKRVTKNAIYPKIPIEQLENGNVIRPTTKGLVPASQLRAKLCQAYFYLERDTKKAREAISYCITQVDQSES